MTLSQRRSLLALAVFGAVAASVQVPSIPAATDEKSKEVKLSRKHRRALKKRKEVK